VTRILCGQNGSADKTRHASCGSADKMRVGAAMVNRTYGFVRTSLLTLKRALTGHKVLSAQDFFANLLDHFRQD